MPLAFQSLSHGTVAFGFFNIESDLRPEYVLRMAQAAQASLSPVFAGLAFSLSGRECQNDDRGH
jgi:hypothetical protein